MQSAEQKAIVGVPFYDGEEPEVLVACLENLDRCLNNLDVDTKIVIGINGPRVSLGKPPLSLMVNKSKFNADISFIKALPGLVAAEKTICRQAEENGFQRIFLTDADISRLPLALYHMWHQGDRPIVGANYTSYPLEILRAASINLAPEETALMKIFEADKHPLAREFTWQHRPEKRLKGSLLLVDPKIVPMMFGDQGITSDSQMNIRIPLNSRQIVPSAAFMHYARVSLIDHIQARLRHFRAAAAEKGLVPFAKKSIIYDQRTADEIAGKILEKYPEATDVASNFLLQCALRHQVTAICRTIALGKHPEPAARPSIEDVDLTKQVRSFREASEVVKKLLSQVRWEDLDLLITNGKGITQGGQRVPINLEPFLRSEKHRQIILAHLGLSEDAKV